MPFFLNGLYSNGPLDEKEGKKKKLDSRARLLVFFSDVRLTTSVILSMKWYVSEQEVMDFQFKKKKGYLCIF